ncbi:MAG: hypothetical protein AAGG01_16520, partial [Planctomycetota bacterium]
GLSALPRARRLGYGAGAPLLGAIVLAILPVWNRDRGLAVALVNEGHALVEQEDYDGAGTPAVRAWKWAPDFFDVHRLLALVRLKQGQSSMALQHLERAYELAPSDWQVRAWMGIALGEAGDLPRAFSFLQGAALERPEALPVVSNAAALALAMDRPGDAIAVLRARVQQQAVGLDPAERNVVEEAIAVGRVANAAEIAAADEGLRLQLAWLLSTSKDPALRSGEEAVEVLENVSDSPRAANVRAAALAEMGAFEEARELTRSAEHRAAYAAGRPWRE